MPGLRSSVVCLFGFLVWGKLFVLVCLAGLSNLSLLEVGGEIIDNHKTIFAIKMSLNY